MGLQYTLVCDCCGKQLTGFQGRVPLHGEYIEIKGTMTMQLYDKETGEDDHVFVTKKPGVPITVCNFDCLKALAERRKAGWQRIKQNPRNENYESMRYA